MIRKPDLPDAAAPGADARISAPAALRNREPILSQLLRLAPERGRALELASGTGEHVVAFAPALPGLTWQPSEPNPVRRASISAWMAASPAANICPPLALDAATPGWAARHGPVDLLLLVNLLHLISDRDAGIVLSEIAKALSPGGRAVIYGPFLRDGAATSPGDAAFHDSLRAQDPAIGYKDVGDVIAALETGGLRHLETVPMPANNLLIAAERPGEAVA